MLTRFEREAEFEEELIVEAGLERWDAAEEYRVNLFRAAGGPRTRLLAVEGDFRADDREIAGEWDVSADRGGLGAFVFADRLPDFGLAGRGLFAFDTDTHAFRLAGEAEDRMDELEAIRGELRRLGGFDITGRFDFFREAVGFFDLASGRLEIETTGSLDGPLQASLLFRDGLVEGAEEPIPPIYLDLAVRPGAERWWEVEAPLRIDRPGAETELTISGEVATAWSPREFDLRVSGEHLVLPHLLELGEAFARPDAVSEPVFETDPEPFRMGWEGTLRGEFVTVQLGEGYSFEEMSAEVRTDAERIAVSADTVFLGSPVSARAGLVFRINEERPYELAGVLRAPHIDVSGLFHRAQADRPNTLVGFFAVSGDLEGTGKNLAELVTRLGGEARFVGKDGILRLFYTENPLVGLGIAGLLDELGGELGTIIEIANELGEVPFEQAEAILERDEGRDLRLHSLQVIATELHLHGAGVLRHEEETDFLEQPMSLELELAARGGLEELLGRAGVLGEERDELGYRRMATGFTIGGTPADPDVAPLFSVIPQAILELTTPIPGRAAGERERAPPPCERDPEYGSPPRNQTQPRRH